MKFYLYLPMIVLSVLLTGCGYSSWNVMNDDDEPMVVHKAQKKQPAQEVKVNTPEVVQQDVNETKKPQRPANAFHIDEVIKTWGEPNLRRPNVYIWKNCKATGKYIDKCEGDTCETVPETKCCERALKTDSEGYVLNLKQAISACM